MFKSLAKAFEAGLKLTKHSNASAVDTTLLSTNFFVRNLHTTPTNRSRLMFMHERAGGPSHRPKTKMPICGDPQLRGVVLKVLILKPKKPNSGNRKCVLVRLSNGKEVKAYVPGEAHNLQEHSVVLVEGGKKKDLMGVNCRVMRGKFDCNPTKRKEKELKKFAASKKSG